MFVVWRHVASCVTRTAPYDARVKGACRDGRHRVLNASSSHLIGRVGGGVGEEERRSMGEGCYPCSPACSRSHSLALKTRALARRLSADRFVQECFPLTLQGRAVYNAKVRFQKPRASSTRQRCILRKSRPDDARRCRNPTSADICTFENRSPLVRMRAR